mmetsp:Transcript_22873/g.54012  ORF Transcript_22873/g.54012 Transcript_22873/m.54012 type:complete len:328 (+) Transcript_22873:259-1242(+)|eukprot:CAMPEP_0172412870 /NCGR_PEP_ID=MMETSP1061-20121228/78129_1 /TAXON_ID=37318 /ORGANISM="Pseudo-nitzschia pungens, Strain cf. pungens" /LENGTH=327 /DNA_ID=CAMNT_0013149121 /DNA_START=254 /DNA_END=1237 /DNA_ORIENTATION=+
MDSQRSQGENFSIAKHVPSCSKNHRASPLFRSSACTTLPLVAEKGCTVGVGKLGLSRVRGMNSTANPNISYHATGKRREKKEEEEAQHHEQPPKQSQPQDTSVVPWRIRYEDLPLAPFDASLERLSIKIHTEIPLRTLMDRISDFFSRSKVVCAYRTDGRIDCRLEAGAIGEPISAPSLSFKRNGCYSRVGSLRGVGNANSQLKFVVQLWRNDHDDNYRSNSSVSCGGGGIILEVQRRRGCTISMCRIRRLLYKFLEKNGCPFSFASRTGSSADKKGNLHVNGSNLSGISGDQVYLGSTSASTTITMVSFPSSSATRLPTKGRSDAA